LVYPERRIAEATNPVRERPHIGERSTIWCLHIFNAQPSCQKPCSAQVTEKPADDGLKGVHFGAWLKLRTH